MQDRMLGVLSRLCRPTTEPKSSEPSRSFLRSDNLPDWRSLFKTDPDLWRESVVSAATGKRVLIASNVGGHGPVSVVESMLAVALTLRGAKVHTLLCDSAMPACMRAQYGANVTPQAIIDRDLENQLCRSCFGRGHLVYEQIDASHHQLSSLITDDERAIARRTADAVDLHDIKDWSWNGLALGEHALAGALRFYARGQLDLDNPEEASVLRRYIESAILTAFGTTRLIEREGITEAVFHHGIYIPQGVVGEVCRQKGVHVSNWVVAYRRNTLIFSHDNTYHQTLMHEPVSHWENLSWNEARETEILNYLRSRWEGGRDWIYFHEKPDEDFNRFLDQSGLTRDKPIIGMLTNVFWDAQLHFAQNAFSDMLDWVIKTITWFRDHPELQLLIRIHPAEVRGAVRSRQLLQDEIANAFAELPKNVVVIAPDNSISTYAAMLHCDSVLIYGTKMGVELSSVGMPVIVAGEAWIRNKGLTTDANSEAEYLNILSTLPLKRKLDPDTLLRARKYAYHFFFRRMLPVPFIDPMEKGPNFKITLGSLRDLKPGRYPGLDVICNGILDSESAFIYPAETHGLHDAL